MKKFMKRPDGIVDDMLAGAVQASVGLRLLDEHRVVVRRDAEQLKADNRVSLISGGGAGHEPAHAGYVGRGLLTAAVCGEVFTSPSTDAVLAAIRHVAGPAGVLLIVKNYTGDRLNFGLAAEIARAEGVQVEMLVVADDASISDEAATAGKRGIAGTVLIHKIAGAAAEEGRSLKEVLEIAQEACSNLATMGVALSSCIVPAAGKPSFSLGDDEVEFGLGIHGEPGVERTSITPVDSIVDRILSAILPEALSSAEPVALLVNNLGATPSMEIAVVANEVLRQARARSVQIERIWVGTFLTALEMAGMSISALRIKGRTLEYLDAPAEAFAWPGRGVKPSYDFRHKTAKSIAIAGNIESVVAGTKLEDGRLVASVLPTVFQALLDAEPDLTELDRKVGDGDLGLNLARGAKVAWAELARVGGLDAAGMLRWLSGLVRVHVGGTSGALYAIGLMRAAGVIEKHKELDIGAWRDALKSAADGISGLGGAQPGDRTMLDALLPAVNALSEGALNDRSLLEKAVAAAEAGAEQSSLTSSRKGRSSYLGERAIGHRDPGAQAVVFWLKAISDALQSLNCAGDQRLT